MNIAMTLYSKYFHPNRFDIAKAKDILQGEILKMTDNFKCTGTVNQNETITFSDNSKLIFTHDNVQVTLF